MPIYNQPLSDYIQQTFAREDHALQHIRDQLSKHGLPAIHIKPEEGQFLSFLAAACGAQLALEIGTLGGYSGAWIARGLAPNGQLITLEKEPDRAQIARENFKRVGLGDKVEVRQGDAMVSLSQLASRGPFDLIFIDARKEDYPAYIQWSLGNVRVGGVIAAHNAFRRGKVTDDSNKDADVVAIRNVNALLAGDPRLISTIYPAGDGIVVAVRRGG
jgi:caffeoyl-CoA O-methyltransferase